MMRLVPEMRLETGLPRNTTPAATCYAARMRPVGFSGIAVRDGAALIATNWRRPLVPVDAYRGYGRPEGAYIAERAIDMPSVEGNAKRETSGLGGSTLMTSAPWSWRVRAQSGPASTREKSTTQVRS
jgi:hypothetical protein